MSELVEYSAPSIDPSTAAVRFAPRLYIHPSEPFEIIDVIPVAHPDLPMVAYHIFFEEDALVAGRGDSTDHEVVWIEYDLVTLKLTDVATLWHRAVLRTDACLLDAKASGQRPSVLVQWGQHGMLPLGWETLPTVRPRAELFIHYQLSRTLSRIPGIQSDRFNVHFQGSYEEYLQFTQEIDTAVYLEDRKIVVAECSTDALRARLGRDFRAKQEWPF